MADLDRIREELTETQHRLEQIEEEIQEHAQDKPDLRLIDGGSAAMRIGEWLSRMARNLRIA